MKVVRGGIFEMRQHRGWDRGLCDAGEIIAVAFYAPAVVYIHHLAEKQASKGLTPKTFFHDEFI